MQAAEMAADILLTDKAVGLALRDALKGFCGTAFVLAEDMERLMPADAELDKGVKPVSPQEMDAMLQAENSSGPF